VSVTIFGPPSADTGTDGGGPVVGLELVVAAAVVDVVDDDAVPAVVLVVDVGAGRFGVLLLHALSNGSAAIMTMETSRSRRTQRS
jgi:hypothetical protein